MLRYSLSSCLESSDTLQSYIKNQCGTAIMLLELPDELLLLVVSHTHCNPDMLHLASVNKRLLLLI